MQLAKTAQFEKFDASSYKVGIVVAEFNTDITFKLLESAGEMLGAYSVAAENLKVIHVAGCVELPVVLRNLAQTKQYDCLIALGCVIRGDTTHYDYVCKITSEGILRVMMDYGVPVGFGILTVEDHEQALQRASSGGAAVEAALQAVKAMRAI